MITPADLKAERYILSPSCALYLPLWKQGGASLVSSDAYGHTCTVYGALWTPQGRSFDGDDYINIPASASLTLTTKLTWEAWMNLTANPLAGQYPFIMGHRGGGNRPCMYIVPLTSIAHINLAVGVTDVDVIIGNIGLGSWKHLVMTYDGDLGSANIKTYLGGVFQNSGDQPGSLANTNTNLQLGADTWYGNYLNGRIGEVLICNRVFSAAEIQHNYLATKWRYV